MLSDIEAVPCSKARRHLLLRLGQVLRERLKWSLIQVSTPIQGIDPCLYETVLFRSQKQKLRKITWPDLMMRQPEHEMVACVLPHLAQGSRATLHGGRSSRDRT